MGQKYSNMAVCTDNRTDITLFFALLYSNTDVQKRDLCQYGAKSYRIIRTADFDPSGDPKKELHRSLCKCIDRGLLTQLSFRA